MNQLPADVNLRWKSCTLTPKDVNHLKHVVGGHKLGRDGEAIMETEPVLNLSSNVVNPHPHLLPEGRTLSKMNQNRNVIQFDLKHVNFEDM